MKNVIDKVKSFFVKCIAFIKKTYTRCADFCKEKAKNIKWKDVWDKTTTVLLVLVLSSPLFILAYIMVWFYVQSLF